MPFDWNMTRIEYMSRSSNAIFETYLRGSICCSGDIPERSHSRVLLRCGDYGRLVPRHLVTQSGVTPAPRPGLAAHGGGLGDRGKCRARAARVLSVPRRWRC